MSHKPLLRSLRGEPVWPPPIWLLRQAGRYLPEYRALRAKAGGFLDLCLTPDYAAEATLQPIRRFAFQSQRAVFIAQKERVAERVQDVIGRGHGLL